MLAGKVEDMLNTVVRQIAFATFEIRVHDERREAELTPDRIAEIWLEVQRESLGPAIRLDGVYRHYWSYIPHFIHTPFYVYAYAFGDCLVNSLYAVYQEAHQGFAERYLDMLRAGGTLRHKELLAPVRPRRRRPRLLVEGPLGRLRLHRRTRSARLKIEKMTHRSGIFRCQLRAMTRMFERHVSRIAAPSAASLR